MANRDDKPWWELAGTPRRHEAHVDAERVLLLSERARTWRERLEERDRRRASMPVPPPDAPPRAA